MAITNTGTNTPFNIKDYWMTDPEVVRRLEEVLGFQFDVDVCGSPGNKKAPKVIADEHWWRVHPYIDSLTYDWNSLGKYQFMNPPFTLKPAFLARAEQMARRGGVIVGMVPHAPATAWYREMEQGISEIYMPDKRVNYLHPITGKRMNGVNFETVFPIWKQKTVIHYGRFSL